VGEPLSPEPSPSPIRAPSHPANELEALQQALAHSQRQVKTLQSSLTREKQKRVKGAAIVNEDIDEEVCLLDAAISEDDADTLIFVG